MESTLGLEIIEVVEQAAIASARWMGKGEKDIADEVAVEAMRERMNQIHMRGKIVIGEGERDDAPMLFIGEEVGICTQPDAEKVCNPTELIEIDIALGENRRVHTLIDDLVALVDVGHVGDLGDVADDGHLVRGGSFLRDDLLHHGCRLIGDGLTQRLELRLLLHRQRFAELGDRLLQVLGRDTLVPGGLDRLERIGDQTGGLGL